MKKLLIVLALVFIAATPLISVAQEFVPLTNLPGIKEVGNEESLPVFFNSLYKLCIGAAAVIAILQIMRAGTYFMFNKGSVAHNEKGKSLIMNAILGLLLVLSPAIVFGIINPDILDLRLDFSKLQPERSGEVINQWMQECGVQGTPEQSQCVAAIPSLIRADYNECIKNYSHSACTSTARADFITRVMRVCKVSSNNTQLSCLEGKVNTFLSEELGVVDPGRSERCDVYDPKSVEQRLRDRNTGEVSCPAGKQVISDRCCVLTDNDYACCGRPASTVYVAAYYVTVTKSNGESCLAGSVTEHSSVGTNSDPNNPQGVKPCDVSYVEKYWTAGSVFGQGTTVSNPRWLEKCTPMPRGSYTLPADKNTCTF